VVVLLAQVIVVTLAFARSFFGCLILMVATPLQPFASVTTKLYVPGDLMNAPVP
jgi:hypothetical protein